MITGALAAALLVAAEPALAEETVTDFYASPAGGGTACTAAAPCTLAEAKTQVQAEIDSAPGHIVVNLETGTYPLTAPLNFGPDDSGRDAEHTVTWRAAPGADPVLSGAATVSGWTQVGSTGVWKAPAPAGVTDTRQLYIDDKRAVRARGEYFPEGFTFQLGYGYSTTPEASLENWKNPDDIEVVWHWSYLASRCPVASVATNTVTMAQPCWANAHKHPGLMGVGANQTINFLENAFELLNEPGEWYLDKTGAVAGDSTPMVYYKPRAGESLTGAGAVRVTVPTVEQLLTVSGTDADERVHDLKFQGLTFADATWLVPNGPEGYAVLQAGVRLVGQNAHYLTYSGWSKTPAAVVIAYAEDVAFEQNTVTRIGSTGIDVEKSSNTVSLVGNHVFDVSATGVQIGDITLQDQRPGAFRHTEHSTTASGASFSYPFTGTGIDFLTTLGTGRGTADVYIDDVKVQSVNCHASGTRRQELCASVRGLSAAAHTLKIVRTGTGSLGLDALRTWTGSGPGAVADDTHASISYTGTWTAETGLQEADDAMHDITVQSNYVHNVGAEFVSALGIWGGFTDTLKLLHNEVANVPYTGISLGWGWGYLDQGGAGDFGVPTTPTVAGNNEIVGNYVHHHLIGGEDGGGIYVLGDQPGSIQSENHIAQSNELGGTHHGLYLDNGSRHWTVSNNVINRAASWILVSEIYSPPYATDNTITGNWANTSNKACCQPPGSPQFRNNTYTANNDSIVGQAWPTAAQQVIDEAGLEPAYRYLHGTASTLNLALGATAVASNVYDGSGTYAANRAIDGSMLTRWATTAATTSATLDVMFPQATTLNRVVLREAQHGTGHIDAYSIEYWNGTAWVTVAAGPQPGVVDEVTFPSVTTTKIRLTAASGSSGPTVQELEVYLDQNVAQGKTASQSSTDYGGVASRAVDGNTDGDFFHGSVTHTANDVNAWWKVDLGGQTTVSGVNVFNRTDGAGDRLSDYWVFLSPTPFNTALTPAQQSAEPGVASWHQTAQAGSPTTLSLENAVGRYLMIQLNGTGYLSLTEVQAFGTPLPPSFTGTGFEAGNPQPTWVNTAEANGVMNIVGTYPGVPVPFADLRTGEQQHGGSWALAFAGKGTSSTGPNFSYAKVFNLASTPSVLTGSSTLSYWIYPNSAADPAVVGNNSTCVALDLVFTDGTTLRDSTLTDQDGDRIHPAHQCGHLTTDSWNQVSVNLGSLSGKRIDRILLGYDHPQTPGGFHGWIDDIAITY